MMGRNKIQPQGFCLSQYQILRANSIGSVWQTVGRIDSKDHKSTQVQQLISPYNITPK